ncbi:xaa-Arg dipeptidase-like [Tubulanus polymorphus]|uniref:xaa-Arg dipeptidase-like n=1 Tax=Tubulanus polymorphus TaxID=672921 RepID=UPI003DA363DD
MSCTDINVLKAVVSYSIQQNEQELGELSQKIWKNPELGFNEFEAHRILTEFLRRHGFEVEQHYILETGFRCSYGVDGGVVVCLICEYDALPEIGHACGHNLIAECGAGAAVAVKTCIEKELKNDPDFKGKVIVLGTPAEESYGGKIHMIRGGALDGVDIAIMAHPFAHETVTPGVISRIVGKAIFRGKSSHAAGAPWDGQNALDAAVTAYQSLACLRQHMKPGSFAHAIISKGGSRVNVIPDEAILEVAYRTTDTSYLRELIDKAKLRMTGAALATECQVEISFEHDSAYDAMIHNHTLCKLYEENGRQNGVEFYDKDVTLGSSDMGNISQLVPSIHPCFSIGTDAPNHSYEFTTASGSAEAQKRTLQTAKSLAMTAVDVLFTPGLLLQIQTDFRNQTTTVYQTFEGKV